tara:strand:+ start:1248 stop:1859 length:612 start_codon:yes stop_codon:yes gene_type:complete
MAVVFKLRGPDGKFIKGEAKNLEKSMTTFASNIIKEGRAILNKDKKRTKTNTLFNEYHYTMKTDQSSITLGFGFGKADNYWRFVDQGVKGKGYADASENVERKTLRNTTGSPFSFKYTNPKGKLVNAIQGWIGNKPISLKDGNQLGAAFAIGYSIKRRGLERTMFYSKPVEKALKTLPNDLVEAFRLDFGKLINKLPNKITIE